MIWLSLSTEKDKQSTIQRIYDEYYKSLLSYARYKLARANDKNYNVDSYDIVQNVFLNLLQYIPEKVDYEKAYVFTILDNEIYKFLNKKTYYEELELDDNEIIEDDFFDSLCTKEQLNEVTSIINSLDEKFRVPLLLRYEFDLSVETIATRLNSSISTTYYRLQKGRLLVKNRFDDGGCKDE